MSRVMEILPTPRMKDTVFEGESLGSYVLEYSKTLHEVLTAIDPKSLEEGLELLKSTHTEGKRIYVAGNGGSSAVGEHLCCDWTLGTDRKTYQPMKTYSLASNLSVLTALANDVGYDQVFSEQVRTLVEEGDLLILISSSGNSKNIVNAAHMAKKNKIRTLSFTGFSGGELARVTDVSIRVNFPNYGLVEDAHQILMHCFAQFIARERSSGQKAF